MRNTFFFFFFFTSWAIPENPFFQKVGDKVGSLWREIALIEIYFKFGNAELPLLTKSSLPSFNFLLTFMKKSERSSVNKITYTFAQTAWWVSLSYFSVPKGGWEVRDLAGSIQSSWIWEPALPADYSSSQEHSYHIFCNPAASKTY